MRTFRNVTIGAPSGLALVLAITACPLTPVDEDDAGSSGSDAGMGTDAGGGDAGQIDECLLDDDITADRTLTKACSPYVLEGRLRVNNDATLTIEPGVELRFPAGSWLEIGEGSGGTLVADGTAAEPIVFTSSEPQPTTGSWVGVTFEEQVLSGTSITYAEIRYGGESYYNSTHNGCLSINSEIPGRVTVENVLFADCAQSGVAALQDGFAFASFATNAFEDSDAGMWLNAIAVGSVASDHSFTNVDHNLIDGDTIVADATWEDQGIPWDVDGSIRVQGTDNPTLTLGAGLHLRFAADIWLGVGENDPGSLVANGTAAAPVLLESSDSEPTAGSWVGVWLDDSTSSGTALAYTVVKDAGQNYYNGSHDGCLSITSANAGRVSVTNSRFENCEQSGVAARQDGFAFESFASNSFVDAPTGLWLHPTAVGSVAGDQTFTNTPKSVIDDGFVVESATWLAQTAPYHVEGNVKVRSDTNQPVLTLAEGLTLRFAENVWLSAGEGEAGGLVVAGTSTSAVTLESSQASPTAGSWVGVWLDDYVLAGTSISYAQVRDGGENYYSGTHHGCLVITSANAGRVAVDNSSFTNCLQSGVAAHNDGFAFADFTANSFGESPAGLWLTPTAVGSVAAGQTFTSTPKNQIDGGDVVETATWLAQDVPYHIEGSIKVRSDANQPVLTLGAGLDLAFGQNLWLSAGEGQAGGLMVAGVSGDAVTLRSSQPGATSGSWVGVWLDGETLSGTTIDYAAIQDAGENYYSGTHLGSVIIDTAPGRAAVTNSSFSNNALSDIWVGCDSAPTMSGNGGAVVVYEDNC